MEQTRRQRRDAGAWREVLERFAESGRSVAEFCEHEGIGAASFYRWRSLLSSERIRKRPPARSEPPKAVAAGGFLDLGTLGASASRMEVRLDLGGGVVVHVVRG